ncbi:MAG: sodium/solute symporter [Lentisphaeria bacterium]|nr:sodium/solute symporter [Lentisphaeria bacterium]
MVDSGLTWIDNLVIVVYLAGIVALGVWHGMRQKNTEEFLLAGRSMKWWPIAISLFAAFFSSISYVAIPGEAYNYGTTMFIAMIFNALPVPIALLVFLKLFYKLKLWTAYEYLENRFSLKIRVMGSIVFLLTRCVYLGVALYATALMLEPALGWSMAFSIGLVGVVGFIYAAFGGLKGVIWTDVAQFVVLVGGVLAIIVFIWWKLPNGVVDIWNTTIETKHGFNVGADSGFWDFDFSKRITIWAWLIAAIPACIAPATDQVNLQLCLSCKDYKSLSKSMIGSAVGGWPVVFLFYIAGLALLAYVKILGQGTPIAALEKGDKVYTYFVTHIMPIGFRGLIVAGLLAAIMSTVVSVLNSLATVSLKDIYQRTVAPNENETHYLVVSKVLTIAWGLLAVGCGIGISVICAKFDVPLLEISNTCLGIFSGLLMGLFALGLLNFKANSVSAIIGVIGSLIVTFYFAIFHFLMKAPGERMSFLWFAVLAPFGVFAIGSLAGLFVKSTEKRNLVVWGNSLLKWEKKDK